MVVAWVETLIVINNDVAIGYLNCILSCSRGSARLPGWADSTWLFITNLIIGVGGDVNLIDIPGTPLDLVEEAQDQCNDQIQSSSMSLVVILLLSPDKNKTLGEITLGTHYTYSNNPWNNTRIGTFDLCTGSEFAQIILVGYGDAGCVNDWMQSITP